MNFILNSLLLNLGESLKSLWESTGLYTLVDTFTQGGWQNLVMILISFVLFYLAIKKQFEPLLLLPIAFGMFIVNVPGVYKILFGTKGYVLTETATNTEVARGTLAELTALFSLPKGTTIEQISKLVENGATILGRNYGAIDVSSEQVIRDFGLFYYIYKGVDWVIFPPIIFLGIGAMTDFGPLIANPKSMLMGAAAQLGIFITFFGAYLLGFTDKAAAAIAIIGGADGPTAIYVAKKLAEDLLPAIAIAAYSYMALIPIIQKPIMRAVTTKKERAIKMKQLRKVSKLEKVAFPIVVSLVVGILLPDAMPLLGMLMLGNLLRESGVCGRLVDTAQNGLMNTVTIFLGVMVGSKATGALFLSIQTIGIIFLGLFAFCMGTLGGLLVGKLMCKLSGGKINPLIGSAGVSAVPMAARISQDVGRETDPDNHLLMHAMGPNVAGVIGSAIAAGVLLALFG
ncbi:MAG: sodium ion-translocating decarboxylase subunit beta [Clostridia bacterium]|nr:sodium ion-translocating decarboxylase subunit beta [Clostridia bacterium]